MQINLHEAKTQLSRHRKNSAGDEGAAIAKAGKPMVLESFHTPSSSANQRTP